MLALHGASLTSQSGTGCDHQKHVMQHVRSDHQKHVVQHVAFQVAMASPHSCNIFRLLRATVNVTAAAPNTIFTVVQTTMQTTMPYAVAVAKVGDHVNSSH